MKNITKKQWGIAGTSIGSILIIVALLTMVGVGSNDTYAADSSTKCTCPSGYDRSGNVCKSSEKTKTVTCASGNDLSFSGGLSSCPSDAISCQTARTCTDDNGNQVNTTTCMIYTCEIPVSQKCSCPNGMTAMSDGTCKTIPTEGCPAGQYYDVNMKECNDCPAGSYCPGAGTIVKCPANADCTATSFTCHTGYKKTDDNQCVKDETSSSETTIDCEPGTYFDGKTKNCLTCPKGSYCPGTTLPANTTLQGTAGLFKCPTGKTTNTTGAKRDTYCIDDPEKTCDDGSYKTVAGYCEKCPAGSYCKNGMKYDCPTNTNQGQSTCGSTTTCTSIGAKCTLNGKSGTCIGSGSNVGGLVCKIETSGSDVGDDPNTPSGGDPNTPSGGDPNTPSGGDPNTPSGGDPNTPSGGDPSSGGNGNTNQNPNTATKTPLVIAIIGTVSMALGTFAYFKGKKEINTEI